MRPSLRSTLIQLVLSAAPLAATGCFDGEALPDGESSFDGCSEWHQLEAHLAEPPPREFASLVDACEADWLTCGQLCDAVLAKALIDSNVTTRVTRCIVTHDATGHDVDIGYYKSNGTNGCPIVEGRRPAGLTRTRTPRAGIAATHLARAAWYEAASVHAFVSLARELARHGAPVALRDGAKRAALDEVHHARLMGDLARARGATPPPVAIENPGLRSLESIAIENVTEGIVGETWAALIAFWQAAHATDPTMRATYARIAEDELRHAELSMEVDAWARTKLTPAARGRVEAARKRAVAKLAKGVKAPQLGALVDELGMPDTAAMQKLFADARERVWA